MSERAAERAGFIALSIAAFVVGLVAAPRLGCDPRAPGADRRAQIDRGEALGASARDRRREALCPEPTERIIWKCPPTPEPSVKMGEAVAKPKKKSAAPLPPIPPLSAGARRELLAWARDESQKLAACRRGEQAIYRVAVVMRLEPEDGSVRRVSLNATRGEVPRELLDCVRAEIAAWEPPYRLVAGRDEIVFGLTI